MHRSIVLALPLCLAITPLARPAPDSRPASEPSTPIAWSTDLSVAPGAKGLIFTRDGQRLLCPATARENGRVVLRIHESHDDGKTFTPLAGVVDADVAGTDLGDAALLEARDGSLWISYRKNHTRGTDSPRYAIDVARSTDGGKTWTTTTVAESHGTRGQPSRGLWASFLFERSDGAIQCYYDDEDSPFPAGKPGHQWVTMKTWDPAANAWTKPVTASRSQDASLLSRDGMMSVVETSPMHLLMVFESVQTTRPHANVVRRVTSDDGGATWSWASREREIVYSPPRTDGAFMALAPWMVRCNDGRLIVVFCTDEDRDRPFVSGTPADRMRLDVKSVVSVDDGKTWSASQTVFGPDHHYYLASVAGRAAGNGVEVLAACYDFADGASHIIRGKMATAGERR